MKKTVVLIFLIVACCLAGFFVTCEKTDTTEPDTVEAPVDTTRLLINHIQECSRLYTAEVEVHKVVTHDDDMKVKTKVMSKEFDFKLPLGTRKVAIPIDATLKAYVDFSEFDERNVERNGDRIEIILPDPRIVMTQTKVKNEEVRRNVPWFRSDFTDEEMTKYEAQGRKEIEASIPQMELIPMAREGAAKVLVPLLEQLGYEEKNITITFRKEFTFSDIKKLILTD